MARIIALFLAMAMVALSGCPGGGGGNVAAPPEDAAVAYGRSVRGMVSDLQNPEGVESAITNLVENMAGYETAAVGDKLDSYRQIYEGAQALQEMQKKGAGKSEMKTKIDELVKLADTLPGGGAVPTK